MDLNDVWQGNKRFILSVGAGFVLLLIGKAIIGSLWGSAGLGQSVRSLGTKLRKGEAPRASQLTELQAACTTLDQDLEQLYAKLKFETDPEYLLPKGGQSPDLTYNEIRSRAHDELVEAAGRRNIDIDETLGLPGFTPSGREAIQRYLRGLNVVEQIVQEGIIAGVRAIPEIEITENKGRRKKSDSFIDPLRVRFKVEGSTASIAELVKGLVRSGERFFSVEDAKIEVDTKRAFGLTTLQLTVAALTIDPEVAVAEGAKP